MGGKSKSQSSTSQSTTTRDERIAATDNATVIKDSLNSLSAITVNTLDAGAISSNKDITLAVLANAKQSVNDAYEAGGAALDKFTEFLTKANEKTTTETTGAAKLAPYLLIGVSVVALSMSLKK